jgi:hypothetical protein
MEKERQGLELLSTAVLRTIVLYIGAYTLDLMINIEVDRRKGGEPKKRVEREWREGMRDGGTGGREEGLWEETGQV